MDSLCDKVTLAHCVLHGELEVRESFDEAGKKPGPGLGVQRGGLQAHRGIGDVVLRTHVGLCRVVALVEDLDPAARGGLVVFYRGCVARLRCPVGSAWRPWSRYLPPC